MDFETVMNGLDVQVISLLKEKNLTLTTTESLTGGMAGAILTSVSGASAVYKQGFITYCNEAKHQLLEVSEETLNTFGAVSSQTAVEMAENGARITQADVCISLTGNAGPTGDEGKPVGLVYIGCYYRNKTIVKECLFKGNRGQVRLQAVKEALSLICERLSQE